jgi:hypothetical protein
VGINIGDVIVEPHEFWGRREYCSAA